MGTTTRYLQPASPSALDCPSSTRLHLLLTPSLTHVPFVRLCNPFPSCSRAPPSISRLCPRSAQRNRPPQQLSPPWPSPRASYRSFGTNHHGRRDQLGEG